MAGHNQEGEKLFFFDGDKPFAELIVLPIETEEDINCEVYNNASGFDVRGYSPLRGKNITPNKKRINKYNQNKKISYLKNAYEKML